MEPWKLAVGIAGGFVLLAALRRINFINAAIVAPGNAINSAVQYGNPVYPVGGLPMAQSSGYASGDILPNVPAQLPGEAPTAGYASIATVPQGY